MENVEYRTVKAPENHLVLAILTTLFCCLPTGIIALVYAIQTNSAITAGNLEAAAINSQKAKFWGMLGFWIGLGSVLLYAVLTLIAGILGVATAS